MERRKSIKLSQNIRYIWCGCFYLVMIVFLKMYEDEFIAPEFERESRQLFPVYSNALFYKVCDMLKFKLVTLLLTSFHVLDALLDLNQRNFASSASKFLFSMILLTCFNTRYALPTPCLGGQRKFLTIFLADWKTTAFC